MQLNNCIHLQTYCLFKYSNVISWPLWRVPHFQRPHCQPISFR